MDELKRIVADNLIRLRQKSGMTQAELGEKLNYSDKTVSKWERAESLPDAYILKKISELFGITVDSLLSPYDETAPEVLPAEEKERSYSSNMITLVAIFGIWTLALFVFVILWLNDIIFPALFVTAIPVSLIVLLVFRSIWNKGKYNFWIVSALVLSLFLVLFVFFWSSHPWQLLLLVVPAELIVYFSFRIKRR